MHAADLAQGHPQTLADARIEGRPPAYIGHSPAARRVQAMVHRAIRTNLPVLLVGAPGSGKGCVARVIHHYGRSEASTLEVVETREQRHLGSLGPFTHITRLEELPLEEQARLPSLVGLGRVVVGTDLDPDSEEGQRRLHAQVVRWASGVRIDLPGLAERIEDLEMLAMDIILRTQTDRPVGGISDGALDCMRSYRWPGNVAELQQVLGEALRNGSTEQLELRDLPPKLRVRDAHQVRAGSPERMLCLEEAEKQAIKRALAYARGNKRKAARILHIGKTTLYRKLKQYDLE